ncbi:MAG TPA: 4'-phosphopantetheinyl transferase superfamily protein [Bacteroidales bacterium]
MFLPEDEIHVFIYNLEQFSTKTEYFQSILSLREVGNSYRYYSETDRQRYILRYGIYRLVLSKYFNISPSELILQTTENGKPFIEKSPISFSFSSNGEYCAIAIGKNQQIGIDIELLKDDSEYRQMAKMFFSVAEFDFLENISDEKLPEAFLKIWTAKEAFIKANKVADPAQFSITFSQFPDQIETLFFEGKSWFFYGNNKTKDLVVTLASGRQNMKIKNIDFDLLSFSKK